MMPMVGKSTTYSTPILDPESEWRAWQVLAVLFTLLVNHQLRRRWLLEQDVMKELPYSQQFRPVLFLESVPTLSRFRTVSDQCALPGTEVLSNLKQKVELLHARIEKGKELFSEIERRIGNPAVRYPTHFCHSCIKDSPEAEIKLTKCGHRVCETCVLFGMNDSDVYECCICFTPTQFLNSWPPTTG